jgi:nucleoside-diphosphate-sugar epimerase
MKRILITGTHSFIGSSFSDWCMNFPDAYELTSIDLRGRNIEEIDFSGYDSVFHVAGIAHVATNHSMKSLYYQVNRDLAIMTAKQAKADKVKQFVFMSSIIVYGKVKNASNNGMITLDTVPQPDNFYGDSKYQAEIGLNALMDQDFSVAIIRPPMVYGAGGKGNYPKLVKIARTIPLLPDYSNRRSMIHIANLCEFIRLVITDEAKGVFFPQNGEYTCTSEMIGMIAEAYGRKIARTRILNSLIHLTSNHLAIMNKIFGNLTYEPTMSEYPRNYRVYSLKESILLTEKR